MLHHTIDACTLSAGHPLNLRRTRRSKWDGVMKLAGTVVFCVFVGAVLMGAN